jgi:outer membrane protein assembly factor BamB
MNFLFISILIILASYQSNIDTISTIPNKTIVTKTADSSLNLRIEHPIAVEYTNITNSDTIFINLQHQRLLVTPKGNVTSDNKLLFEIHPKGDIQKIFPFLIEDDIVIIYSFSTSNNDSGSSAKRISLKNNTEIWEKSIYGFNPEPPVLVNGFIYLSTIGFIGKLNIKTGEFIWEFDDFFKNGNFISFNEPLFYKDSSVLFTEKSPVNATACSILIDNKNSRILKITR